MKKIILLIIIVLYVYPLFSNQIKIGGTAWYSEDIEFTKLLNIAKRENKPILTLFSATWCIPCQIMKKGVLKNHEFKKVKKKFILQYIEQTTPRGTEYVKQFNVSVFPSIKLFNTDGFEIINTIKGNQPGLIKTILSADINKKNFTPTEELTGYNLIKRYKKSIQISKEHLKNKKIKLSNQNYFYELIKAYLNINKQDKALSLRNKIKEFSKNNKPFVFDKYYLQLHTILIKALLKTDKNTALNISKELFSDLNKSNKNFIFLKAHIERTIKMGLHLEFTHKVINNLLKKASGFNQINLLCQKAKVYAREDNNKKAKEIFNDIIMNKKNQNVFALGPVVDSMIELKIINKLTLKAAKLIVSYFKIPTTYSNLSKVYEGLKDYNNAILSLNKAKALEKDINEIKRIERKIIKLKKSL